MSIKSYKDLEVWKKAMDLVVMCYQVTKDFPKFELRKAKNPREIKLHYPIE